MLTENGDLNETFHVKSLLVFCAERWKYDKKSGKEKLLGYSGLSRFRSSLNYYLNQRKITLCDDDKKEMSEFFSGVKKNTARECQTGEHEMQEGKSELLYKVWEWRINHYLLKIKIFWRFMLRSQNISGAMKIGFHSSILCLPGILAAEPITLKEFICAILDGLPMHSKLNLELQNQTKMVREEKIDFYLQIPILPVSALFSASQST